MGTRSRCCCSPAVLAILELHWELPRQSSALARPKSRLVGVGCGQLEGGLAEAEDQVEQERNLKQSTDMSCRKPGPLAAQKGAQFRGGARGARGMASNQTQGWDWRSNQLAGAPRPEAGGQEPAVQPRGLGAG